MMSKTILVVEDNIHMRKAFLEALKVLNFDTLEACNGQEALEIIHQNESHANNGQAREISLVMSDLSMPVMDGKQLFTEIRKLEKDLPFVMITGFMVRNELDELMADGLSGWLMKPADLEQINQLLQGILS